MKDVPLPTPRKPSPSEQQAEEREYNILTVDGQNYRFTLIRPGLVAPNFPYAIGFLNSKTLYISQNVPAEDRPPILAHEIRERFRFSLVPEEVRCTSALAAELSELEKLRTPRDYKTYVNNRAEYFNAVATYYDAAQNRIEMTPEYLTGVLNAASYINNVVQKLR